MTAKQILTAVPCVAISVSEQGRSKQLFERLGLTATMDVELQPGFRWIGLALSGGGTTQGRAWTPASSSTGRPPR
jgi:hypothetical protein